MNPPSPLTANHELGNFDCGEASLNHWLIKRAIKNNLAGASRCFVLSVNAGVFAILVHVLSEPANQFYLSCGFVESPLQPMILMMTLETVKSILAEDD